MADSDEGKHKKSANTKYAILHHSDTNFTAILMFRFAAAQKNTSSTPSLSKTGV